MIVSASLEGLFLKYSKRQKAPYLSPQQQDSSPNWQTRHAKRREPGNLVPGHYCWKIQISFRNERYVDFLSQDGFYIVKIRFKWISNAIYSCIKHPNIDSYKLDRENLSKNLSGHFYLPKFGSQTKIIFLHVWPTFLPTCILEQAGAELCQAQGKLNLF